MTQKVDNFLAHYGKKGMKWGVKSNHTYSGKSHYEVKRLKKQAKYDAKVRIMKAKLDKNGGDINAIKREEGLKYAAKVFAFGAAAVTASAIAGKVVGIRSPNGYGIAFQLSNEGKMFVQAAASAGVLATALKTITTTDQMRDASKIYNRENKNG